MTGSVAALTSGRGQSCIDERPGPSPAGDRRTGADEGAVLDLHGEFRSGELHQAGLVQGQQLGESAGRGTAGQEGEEAVKLALDESDPIRGGDLSAGEGDREDPVDRQQRVENGGVGGEVRVRAAAEVRAHVIEHRFAEVGGRREVPSAERSVDQRQFEAVLLLRYRAGRGGGEGAAGHVGGVQQGGEFRPRDQSAFGMGQ